MKNIPTFEQFSILEKFKYEADVKSIKTIEDLKLILQSSYINIFTPVDYSNNFKSPDLRSGGKGLDKIHIFKMKSGKILHAGIEKDYLPSGYALDEMYSFIKGESSYLTSSETNIENFWNYFSIIKQKGHPITFTKDLIISDYQSDVINLKENYKEYSKAFNKLGNRVGGSATVNNSNFSYFKSQNSRNTDIFTVKFNNDFYNIRFNEYDFEPIKFTATQYYKEKNDAIFKANPKELYNLISDIENWTTKYEKFREDVVKINRKIWQS